MMVTIKESQNMDVLLIQGLMKKSQAYEEKGNEIQEDVLHNRIFFKTRWF